ncbi:unnamed protein product [Adineta ricciae]|uniref:Uncharacterized protein n=1 Tax=Adineta ricciae TaxID=249248 RepID=A0A813VQR0_ADIRI|nr:unnamed protein product [Adineta ricciae]
MTSSWTTRSDTVKCHACGHLCSSPPIMAPNESVLNEQLDWLTVDHDDLRQEILEQSSRPKYHPSMSIIDHWEQESIKRIQRTAYLARQTLINALDEHMLKIEKILHSLTPKLRHARQYIKFYSQNDIKEWAKTLQELKQIPPLPVTIDEDNKIYGIIISRARSKQISPAKSFTFSLNSTSSNSTLSGNEYQAIRTLINDDDNLIRTVEDYSSKNSRNITPGGVLIIRDYENHDHQSTTHVNDVSQNT